MTGHSGKISRGAKIGYAAASIGDACSYGFVGAFLLFFLTSVAGINPVVAGTIAAVGGIVDAACSPVIGYLSDKSTLKSGRRRPFLMIACLPLGIAVAMLFSSVDAGETAKVAYYSVLTIVFWVFFALFFIPYLALGAEITDDYRERTVLRSYAYVFNFFGILFGVVLPTFIVDYLCSAGATTETAWQSAGVIVAVITTASIIITWHCTRGKERAEPVRAPSDDGDRNISALIRSMLKDYRQIFKLKPIRYLIWGSIFFLIANTLVNSDRMYFLNFNLGMSSDTVSKVYLICTTAGIVFVPLIIGTSKVMDKRKTFIVCQILSSAGMIVMSVIGIRSFSGVVVISFIFSLGSSCYWQLLPAMIYDVCEVDELVTGQRREGVITSLQSLAEAVSGAVSVQILGIILAFSGFNGEAAVQTRQTMDWIGYCFTILPALAMIASVIMIVKYPITGKRYDKVLLALERKSRGEEYETEELEELL